MKKISFEEYMRRWNLIPDGDLIETHSSQLLPVIHLGEPAMLKIAVIDEEKRGNLVMAWWNGIATARVLAHDSDAILMERASSTYSLREFSRSGRDDKATRILCKVIRRLHAAQQHPLPLLIPLAQWFRALEGTAAINGEIFRIAATVARELLSDQKEMVLLHGDIHHDNVLYFGPRGWLAIDPKGLYGERYFDYANLFCNPDYITAANPALFARRVSIVAKIAGLEQQRLFKWILAWAGLSAVWHLENGSLPKTALCVAEIAATECRYLKR